MAMIAAISQSTMLSSDSDMVDGCPRVGLGTACPLCATPKRTSFGAAAFLVSWVGYKRRVTEHDPAEYGRNIADDYDAIYSEAFATGAAVDRLVELAAGGPVLELGVGTGRLALPLAERGLDVHGVDGSEKMLCLLRGKP